MAPADECVLENGGISELAIEPSMLRRMAQLNLADDIKDYIPYTTGFSALVYLAFAVVNYFMLDPNYAVSATVAAFATAVIFFAFSYVVMKFPPPTKRIHSLQTGVVIIMHVNAMFFVALTDGMMLEMAAAILIVGVGCYFSSILWAFFTILFFVASDLVLLNVATITYDPAKFTLMVVTASSFAMIVFHFRLKTAVKMERLIQQDKHHLHQLEEAYTKIKTLGGLLPICASCKNVRDDSGYWSSVEEYVSQRSTATFTHGICPECLQRDYSEYIDEDP